MILDSKEKEKKGKVITIHVGLRCVQILLTDITRSGMEISLYKHKCPPNKITCLGRCQYPWRGTMSMVRQVAC